MANAENRTEVRGGGKPFGKIWKKWWFWVIIIVLLGAIGTGNNTEDTTEPTTETTIESEQATTKPEPTQATEAENEPEPTETTETESEPEPTTEPEETTETKGKNIDDIGAHFSVSKVRNDTTENWRISSIAESVNIEEYALSYYKKYFSNDTEIHAIVNFSNNTTTKISVAGNVLDVNIYEYVDGEEHDAKLLFGGMMLKKYFVYIDTGEIEEIQ